MKAIKLTRPDITLSYWLALSSSLIAFAIVSNQLPFALCLGAGAILIHSLSPIASHKSNDTLRFAFTFVAYLAALLPLWPERLSDYYYTPLLLTLGVSLLAAFNRNSDGGSRGITSIAAIAFLLFIRNLVLYFNFEAPLPELASSLGFIAFMEIVLSNRYHKNKDNPHPELAFGLSLALIASFQFTSLLLGIVLAALPILAFLLRNHQLAKIANEHTRPARQLARNNPSPSKRPALIALALIPLVLAAFLYLFTLRLPFWADYLPRNAPYFAQSIAQKAKTASEASDLEDEAIQDISNALVDPDYLKEKATQLTRIWAPKTKQKEAPPSSSAPRHPFDTQQDQNPNSRSYDPNNYDNRLGPFAQSRTSENQQAHATAPSQNRVDPPPSNSSPPSASSGHTLLETGATPPPASLNPGMPGTIDLQENQQTLQNARRSNNPISNSEVPRNALPLPSQQQQSETLEESLDFNRFIDSFEQPDQAISQALNLEGSNLSALLSEEPLVTVKLNASRAAPRRLYLRSNVLDTVNRIGLSGNRSLEGRVEIPTPNAPIIALNTFRQSKSQGTTLTITSNQSRYPTLPLPESFARIQVFGADTLNVYPEERVALAPLSKEPVTYRLYEADLEVTDRERNTATLSDPYLKRMLEIPLDREDRTYLKKLAERVGGSRSPTRQFAYRFANYFANRHPYSYFVSIPAGPGHSVVRWLDNECPGLCSNYAAAFTLLARSRGIPTRVVGGFASNEYDSKAQRFVLRQNNAHAWVEYLDESNRWIRFDPTPGITEAEVRRAAQYVTAARPDSLERLIARETEATRTEPLETAQQSNEAKPSSQALQATEEVPASPPTTDPNNTEQTVPSYATEAPKEDRLPTSQTTSTVERPQPISPGAQIVEEIATPARAKDIPIPPPPVEQPLPSKQPSETSNPPWLLILALFTILIPSIALIMRIQKPKTGSPELQLRQQAGRLLSKLDALIQEHHLDHDPIWIETRNSLSAQRYGREANPILVEDLAIKVALLAKRKK